MRRTTLIDKLRIRIKRAGKIAIPLVLLAATGAAYLAAPVRTTGAFAARPAADKALDRRAPRTPFAGAPSHPGASRVTTDTASRPAPGSDGPAATVPGVKPSPDPDSKAPAAASGASGKPAAPAPRAAQSGTAVQPQVVAIVATLAGFETTQVTQQQGPVYLALLNRTGIDQLTFSFDYSGGGNAAVANLQAGKYDWAGLVDLLPGDYTLSEVNHPNWICKVHVTQ